MPKRRFVYLRLFTIALVTILTVYYILDNSPAFPCGKWGFIKTKSQKYYIHPEKVVIQPWLGQHNVYGVFMLPSGYLHDHLITIKLPDSETFCGIILNAGQSADGVTAKPQHYLVKGYLQTRTTLKLFFQGKIQHLLENKNWRLGSAKF
ncbi:MAG TPA: hypothetical protein VK184_11795 [Nostocaceae cyanobacterium]|nr:hypothetical protein [Nostocaceae cyanobacterium]